MTQEVFRVNETAIRAEYAEMTSQQRQIALKNLESTSVDLQFPIEFIQDHATLEQIYREERARRRILEQMIEQDQYKPPRSVPQISIAPVFHASSYDDSDPAWDVFNALPKIIKYTLPFNAQFTIGRIKENLGTYAAKDCDPIRQELAEDSYALLCMWHYQQIERNPQTAKEQIRQRVDALSPEQLLESMCVLYALIHEKEFTSVFSGKDFEGFATMREEMEFELELIQKRLDSTKPIHEIPTFKVA